MPTITESGLPGAKPAHRAIVALLALFALSVAIALAALIALKPRNELMPIRGWRLLAVSLAALGVVSAIAYHWVALLSWLAMALICLLKDPRAQAGLRRLGW